MAALTFVDSEFRFRRAVSVLLIFGGLIAFVGIMQKLASPEAIYGVRKHSGAIPFGPYVNSHHFASLMVLISGVGVAHLLGNGVKQQTKLLVGIAVGLMAIAAPFTGSRGGVLAYLAMICVAVLAWFYGRRSEERSSVFPLIAGGAVFGLIVIGSLFYLGGESSVLRGFGIENQSADISSGRYHFWSIAWKIFLANPILGAGMDAFGVAFTRFDTQSGIYRVEQAHNDYLQMLADGGLVGFSLAIAFVFILVKRAVKRIREESDPFLRTTIIGGLAGCVGILVHSIFDFPLRTVGNAFVFLLVIGVMLAPVDSSKFATNGRER
jgi:O-antigen ligase